MPSSQVQFINYYLCTYVCMYVRAYVFVVVGDWFELSVIIIAIAISNISMLIFIISSFIGFYELRAIWYSNNVHPLVCSFIRDDGFYCFLIYFVGCWAFRLTISKKWKSAKLILISF